MSEGITDPATAPAPAAADSAGPDARKLQIALVDDDRNILTTVSIALQAEGFATRLYSDGETALKALLDNPPDLAVFDIKMPKMDGMELLRHLRAHSALPVIFLTSKDDESDEEAGLRLDPGELEAFVDQLRAIAVEVEQPAAHHQQGQDVDRKDAARQRKAAGCSQLVAAALTGACAGRAVSHR